MKFTHELEANNCINFLDLTIIKNNNKLITNWFQKSISSNRLINYFSFHPIQQKRNAIFNLYDRAILLSHDSFHNDNIKKVVKILLNNNYPLEFIQKNLKTRYNVLKQRESGNKQNNNSASIYGQLPKVCIPFNDSYFQLSNILKKFNLLTIPKVNKVLSSVIRLGKDSTNLWDMNGIVYKFNCNDCSATYIGESKRTLKTRISEHKNRKKVETVVNRHQIVHNHSFNFENVKVIDREPNYKKRKISEMLHIKCNDFTINMKEDIQFLSNTYFPLLSKLKE